MKRSGGLKRSSSLKRSSAPKRTALRAWRGSRPLDPRAVEYKTVREGICRVCGTRGLVRRHHVILEQRVRREGGDPWDLRNSLWVGIERTCSCHADHHSAKRRIGLVLVPEAAVKFACQLFGRDRAMLELARYYAPLGEQG